MGNCVITSFDDKYWNEYGSSFLGSLVELAGYRDHLLVIDTGLSPRARARLEDYGARVEQSVARFGPPIDRFLSAATYLEHDAFAYWEADVYFQAPIEDAFGQSLGYCLSGGGFSGPAVPNTGFLSGSAEALNDFADFLRFAAEQGETDQSGLAAFVRHFPSLVEEKSLTYNCTELGDLRWDGGYKLGGDIVKVVHPCGPLKHMADGRRYLFREKYREIGDRYHHSVVMGNKTTPRGLLRKARPMSLKK